MQSPLELLSSKFLRPGAIVPQPSRISIDDLSKLASLDHWDDATDVAITVGKVDLAIIMDRLESVSMSMR